MAMPNQPSPSSPNNRQGTGFTNLQNLMQANQGNQLGKAVGQGIEQTGQGVQDNLNKSQQDFNNQSTQNQVGTQSQREDVQNTINNAGNLSGDDLNSASGRFQNYTSGQYKGPQDLNNIDQIHGQASAAQQEGKAIGSEGGRQALLQKYVSNPSQQYGAGAQRLDTMLLGTSGGQPLQQARQSVAGLTGQVNTAQQAAQQTGQQNQKNAQTFGQQVTGQLQQAQGAVLTPAQQAAQQANIDETQRQSAEQAYTQAAQNGQLSAEDMAALGLQAGARTYGTNLAQFVGYNPANETATATNVMGQPQFSQYSNLAKLMGQTVGPQGNAFQAGKQTFDTTGAQAALASAKQPLTAAQSQVNAAQDISKTANQIQTLQQQLQGLPQGNFNPDDPANVARAQVQQQIQDLQNYMKTNYAGAVTNGMTRTDWADTNLANSLANYNKVDQSLGGNLSLYDPTGTQSATPQQLGSPTKPGLGTK